MGRKSKEPNGGYNCENCGTSYLSWQGKCDACGEWNTIIEQKIIQSYIGRIRKSDGIHEGSNYGRGSGASQKPIKLADVGGLAERGSYHSGITELERVLGGGFAAAGVYLLAGEPGVGKSTLLLQSCLGLAAQKSEVLYISAEEVVEQVADRARRILAGELIDIGETATGKSGDKVLSENLQLLNLFSLEVVMQAIVDSESQVIVVDSIQTIASSEITGVTGGIAQVKYCAAELTALAKSLGKTLLLVGHINKDGGVAGPKVLEHLVDVVLQFSGEPDSELRSLRALKNRFGTTSEVGLFVMRQDGLAELQAPEAYFLSDVGGDEVGLCRSLVLEGNRPLVVEMQALVVKSEYAYPKRVAAGISLSRLQVLVAAMQKYTKFSLQEHDIYINVAKGLKLDDPGLDLAIVAAIGSSFLERPLKKAVAFGELNLSGAFTKASSSERRITEAGRLGYKRVVTPSQLPHLSDLAKVLKKA